MKIMVKIENADLIVKLHLIQKFIVEIIQQKKAMVKNVITDQGITDLIEIVVMKIVKKL
jgi:hypothetical protein